MTSIRGGMGIVNPKVKHPGSIGLIAGQGASRYILSCYHVLCRLGRAPFQRGEEIFLVEDTNNPIARVEQGLPDLDAAMALVLDGIEALGGIGDLPPLAEPAKPEEGMPVVKVGPATGKTEGRITRVDDDEVWIEPVDGTAGGPISAGGDSGSVWVCKDTWVPVVLHTGTNDAGIIPYARGLALIRALDGLRLTMLTG